MKAISLWQPWASLIACGAKPYETRDWAPPAALFGERIAIHAAKKVDRGAAEFATDLQYGQHPEGGFELAEKLERSWKDAPDRLMQRFGDAVMPAGCIVATARLEQAYRLGQTIIEEATGRRGSVVLDAVPRLPASQLGFLPHDDFGNYAFGRWAWHLTDVQPLALPVAAVGRQGFFDLPQGWLTNDRFSEARP